MTQSLRLLYGIIILFIFLYMYLLFPVYQNPIIENPLEYKPFTRTLEPTEPNPSNPSKTSNGFVPNKGGSTGLSPNGGMRPSFTLGNVKIGYWGFTPEPESTLSFNMYDNSNPFKEYIIDVGWWNK